MKKVKKKRRLLGRDTLAAIGFLSPSLVGLAIFVVGPIIGAATISLFDWEILTPPKFVGFANYVAIWDELANGKVLRQVFANTLYFTAGTVPLAMAVSLGIALLLNRKLFGVAAFRVIYFLPTVTSIVALSIIWRLMYNPDYGLINRALEMIHLPGPGWLADPHWAMPAIIIMSVWTGIGYNSILYLAGMQGIASSYYDAAQVDGANAWQQFRHVTWPLLSPTTLFIFTMSIISGFQVFTQIFMMTSGKPTPETQVYVYHIYSQAFTSFRMGYASALACVLFVIILSITLIQLSITKRWVHYG
ncbi:MAG TPA: sugar ABC transporter permease [Armatimonadota bacterium]|nr:sugar ABC transporter permease [Armatimonadota bacterium]HOM71770.1 sugar ABC transporter permease [Armatimonadota bacterium]HOP80330.1 sugar ABC transporter permease [Armatimonadota bacterium]HPP74055.1 sugar ABC transporter permease [Armatimonadota bacterium]